MEVSLFHRWHSRAKTGTLGIFKVISMKCKLKKTYAGWYWCPAATDKSFLDQQKNGNTCIGFDRGSDFAS